ncbi:hypothetical protein [Scytonema sp. PCC 10023]|uniref:hypothetical protein n=1 Tax=Scytonema sp. PCC 10023 TaxID=1680591 RepID=UPI0039C727BB
MIARKARLVPNTVGDRERECVSPWNSALLSADRHAGRLMKEHRLQEFWGN